MDVSKRWPALSTALASGAKLKVSQRTFDYGRIFGLRHDLTLQSGEKYGAYTRLKTNKPGVSYPRDMYRGAVANCDELEARLDAATASVRG